MNLNLEGFREALKLNGKPSSQHMRAIAAGWAILFLAVWLLIKIPFIPQPQDLWESFQHLWAFDALGRAIVQSLTLYAESLFWGTVIAGFLAFLTIWPVMRPPIYSLTLLRFLSMAGVILFFLVFSGTGDIVKLRVMIFY